ncbi:DUF3824 domain-containing protein [Ancrocorticia populi]|uniref:Uncharacterized protein n=1 Tax=Ancrocorticia populi TaxID=2175228 RepID=A0A2V1KCX2_9ACTO|nr:DUF3824 domain-containing protein [Ancrocorticia populi]PWF27229.1 hypothetical protein DD236_02190 [Ancrocorticia populi]
MSTNTPPNGFPQGQQPGVPQYQGGPYQPGPFNAPQPAAQKQQKDRIVNLAMCGVPLLIAFIGLFLPYFSADYGGGFTESVSWAQGEPDGPFIISLIFILLAIIPLVMQFFSKVNPKQMVSSSSLVTVAGVVVIGNVAINWNLEDADRLEAYGAEISRSIGFWILLIAGVALVGTGIYFTIWANKQAKLAALQAPNQPYPGQPYPGPQAPGPQGPGQPFGGPVPPQQQQQFGGPAQQQPGAPQQPYASPQSPQTPPPPAAPDDNPSQGSAI